MVGPHIPPNPGGLACAASDPSNIKTISMPKAGSAVGITTWLRFTHTDVPVSKEHSLPKHRMYFLTNQMCGRTAFPVSV